LIAGVRSLGILMTFIPIGVVLAILIAVTWWQTGFWRDDLTLFSRTIEVDGDGNYIAHKNVALYYFEFTHELDKALYHFEKAKAANPRRIAEELPFHVMTLVELGRDEEARTLLRQYENDIVKLLGNEKAYEILRGNQASSMLEAKLATAYRIAYVAQLLGKEPSLDEARRELAKVYEWTGECNIWKYLMWRYLTLSGKKNESDMILSSLLLPSLKKEYEQFRFLRNND